MKASRAESIKLTYRAVLDHFVQHGRAPHYSELARTLGVPLDDARELQRETADAGPVGGCWMAHDTDYIESWAPFSNVPSHFRISVDGQQRWFGQCGMESLAVRWLFPGQLIEIDTVCLDCGEPIHIRLRDEEIIEIEPPSTVGYMLSPFAQWREGSPAFN